MVVVNKARVESAAPRSVLGRCLPTDQADTFSEDGDTYIMHCTDELFYAYVFADSFNMRSHHNFHQWGSTKALSSMFQILTFLAHLQHLGTHPH